jgi:hypothetical protein
MWNHNVQIDRIHSRAICDEIGERLRSSLSLLSSQLPSHFQRQLDHLQESEREESPSTIHAYRR